MLFIDTHTHIDGEEFRDDLEQVIQRAKESGAECLLVPGINMESVDTISEVCARYPGYCHGMTGLHPEDVKADYVEVIDEMRRRMDSLAFKPVAIGEVGLDFYWSREFEQEQLDAFERQVRWSVETGLPLMIHCRKAQNEMVRIMRRYEGQLHGGVFLPQTLPAAVPLSRVVLETDAPYMAPVPHRGERNESSFIPHIIEKMAEAYQVSAEEVARITTDNAKRIFHI